MFELQLCPHRLHTCPEARLCLLVHLPDSSVLDWEHGEAVRVLLEQRLAPGPGANDLIHHLAD